MDTRGEFTAVVRLAFGETLREARKERGLSQELLAELADIDPTTPSVLERGLRQPTLALVILLGRALEVDARELVGGVLERLEEKGILVPACGDDGVEGEAEDTMKGKTEAPVIAKPNRAAPLIPYDEAVGSLQAILLRGLKSIRTERFKRKALARRVGLEVSSLINIERGHRNLLAAELFLFAFTMGNGPDWIVREILRRFENEIGQWRKEAGY